MPLLAEVSKSGGPYLFVAFLIIFMLLMMGLVIGLFVLWIFMLIDALNRKDWRDDDEKLTWTVILVVSFFVSLWGIAAIVYYFVIKKPREAHLPPAASEAQIVQHPKKRTSKKKATKKT